MTYDILLSQLIGRPSADDSTWADKRWQIYIGRYLQFGSRSADQALTIRHWQTGDGNFTLVGIYNLAVSDINDRMADKQTKEDSRKEAWEDKRGSMAVHDYNFDNA